MPQAQEYLNKNYPKEIRNSIKNLLLRGKNLEGHLDLKDFTNLEKLDCCFNQLTSLDLTGLKNLKVLYANDNLLTNLDYSSLDPQKLTGLIIDNNNLPEQDIEVFKEFTNLEDLRIGSDDKEKIDQGVYNRFIGSLESLKNLIRLSDLGISNTDIDSGVNCLPTSVTKIRYSTSQRPENKLKEITEELNSFLNRETNENWQEIHPEFTEWAEREWKNNYFSYQEAEQWVRAGLQPGEYQLAAYLRARDYNPQATLDLEELKEEDRSAQKFLGDKYSLTEKNWESWLDISRSGLTGDLVIENWSNLERLDCYNNQLKSLTLINCPKLTRIECSDNIITNLIINNCSEVGVLNVSDNLLNNLGFLDSLNPEKLAVLYLTNNNFSPQNISLFSKFANLKNLYLTNNRFYGSLQSLNNCKKLEKLSISGTEIIEGLEYLPDDLNEIDSVNAQELGESSSGFKIVRWANLMKEKKYHNVAYYDLRYWKEAQPYFQELKSTWEKLHPGQNIWDFLKKEKIFFNAKSGSYWGSFQGLVLNLQKDQIISEREKKIVELFKENQRLTNLIKEQKEIINDYLRFFPEKEILQKLIQAHLEFTEAKKQNQPFIKLRKQKEAIYNELTEKVGEEVMEEVENVLDKYEKLKSLESELEKTEADLELTENLQKNQIQPFRRKRSQSLLIVEAEYKGKLEAKDQEVVRIHQLLNQVMLISRSQQIINISDVSQSGINIAGDNSYLSNKSTTNYRTNYQQLAAETENQIIAFLSNKEIIPQEQKVINKTILFLGTKELFVNYRQTTINNLIDCYNKLEKRLGSKLHKFTTAVSMTNIAGKLASIIPGGGVAEAPLGILGDTINLTGTIIQGKLLDKFTKQFQEILAKDKKNLSLFDGNYLELRNIIWGDEKTSRGEIVADIIKTLKLERTKISPFSDDYNAFSQSVSGIWQSRSSIDLGEMKSSIEAVINDFAKLKQKLQEEKEQLSRQTWFVAIEEKTDLLKEQTQAQVEISTNVAN